MRKLLISALVVATCLGMGATAFAVSVTPGEGVVQPAAFSDLAGHEAEGELTLLGALGVFTGDSGLGGAVKPDDSITRAQFCKVVVSAFGRSSTAAGLAGLQPTCTDGASIPTWAWGYVNVAVYMGIISGYGDGSFKPNNPVTYAEAVTMLIRAVSGHAVQVGPGVWPYNFLFYGVDNGFTGSVDVGFANLPCTRGDMARMLVATMQVPRLDADGDPIQDSAILYDRFIPAEGEGEAGHAGHLYRGLFLTASHPMFDSNWYIIAYPIEDGLLGMTLADRVHLVGADDYDGLNNLPVWAVTDSEGDMVFLAADGSVTVVSGILADLVATGPGETDQPGEWDTIVLADGTKVPYDHEGDGLVVGVAPPGEAAPVVSGYVPTMLNRMGPLPVLALDQFLQPPVLGDMPGSYLPPEVLIAVDPDGKAVNVVATVFTKETWIAHFEASKVEPDGTKVDTRVEPWESEGWEFFGYYPVPASCLVELNGALSERDALAEDDAISVAFDFSRPFGPMGEFDAVVIDGDGGGIELPEPFIVRAHRELVEGTVTSTSATYGKAEDPVIRATLDLAAGGSKTYVVDTAGGIDGTRGHWPLPAVEDKVKYGLNAAGDIFVPIGFEALTPFVVCRSYTETGDGHFSATFDVRGTEVTYALDAPMPDVFPADGELDWIGQYVYVAVSSGAGIVDVGASHTIDPDFAGRVLAVDAANGTLTFQGPFGVGFFDRDPVVYEVNDDGEKVYVGLAGLTADDWVLYDSCSGDPVFEITEERTD